MCGGGGGGGGNHSQRVNISSHKHSFFPLTAGLMGEVSRQKSSN